MAKQHFLFGLFLFALPLQAQQNDSLPRPAQLPLKERIAATRQNLLASFLADDPAGAALWRDSLTRMEGSSHIALMWDERWLLYVWEESYGNLFDEAARFDATERQRVANTQAPPPDSLFERLDNVLYEQRFQLYERISRGFLSAEEKQFALTMLDYLLRLNQKERASGEWNKRLDAFLRLHPDSRFKPYIKANLYAPVKLVQAAGVNANQGFSLDFLFASGRWRGDLERTVRSPYGFDLGVAYWLKRWNFGIRCLFGWQKLAQPVFQNNFEWPKGDPATLIIPSLEVGYDIVNNRKFRFFPSATVGLSILKPPGTDEEDDNPPPDYYSNFSFTKGCLGAALTADIKLKDFDLHDLGDGSSNAYVSARIRVGYNWLNWGNKNPALRGDMFFFAVGINLFGWAVD